MYISIETIEFFIMLVLSGSVYGWYCYKQGIQRGANEVIAYLEEEQIIYINPETGEIEPY